jgi:glycine oxidase
VERFDVIVVGGGIIGLASALRAQQASLRVCVLERAEPGAGATGTAAGVLAPDRETPEFTALARRSAELWPGFAAELGGAVGYTRCGSLELAFGEPPSGEGWLSGEECRALEPGVAADCTAAFVREEDAQVDPRRVAAALAARVDDVRSHCDVVALASDGVELADGTRLAGDRVVVAAGAWTARRLMPRLPVRPVKGQTLRLRGPAPATRIIRHEHTYVVPRADGETVVGATIEDAGFDEAATDEATALLLGHARRIVPAVEALELVEATASLRPATTDDGPLIGEWEGLVVATGHHRNGILLAPLTADAVAALLTGREPPPETLPFAPTRF